MKFQIPVEGENCYAEFPEDIAKWAKEVNKKQDEGCPVAIIVDNLGNGCSGAKLSIQTEFDEYKGVELFIDKKIIERLIFALSVVKDNIDLGQEREDK